MPEDLRSLRDAGQRACGPAAEPEPDNPLRWRRPRSTMEHVRLLFASTSGAGHFLPLVPWLDAALARGHEVVVLGPPGLAGAAARYRFVVGAEPDQEDVARLWARAASLPKEEGGPFAMAEIFTRQNAGAMLGPARRVVAELRPDVVVREPMEFASGVAATEAGVPQLRVAIGLARLERRFLGQAAPVLEEFCPGSAAAIAGTPYVTSFPASLDPDLVGQQRYRVGTVPAPHREDGPPLVYVTFGTEAPKMAPMAPVYGHALAALADLPVRVLMTVGRDFDVGGLGVVPDNACVQAWADQAEVLAGAALVLHHGGSGTTLGALAAGCPQVVLPLFADQPANARAVGESGVGIGLRDPSGALRREVTADLVATLHDAVESALGDAGLRSRAAEVAAEMAALPTIDEVAAGVIPGW